MRLRYGRSKLSPAQGSSYMESTLEATRRRAPAQVLGHLSGRTRRGAAAAAAAVPSWGGPPRAGRPSLRPTTRSCRDRARRHMRRPPPGVAASVRPPPPPATPVCPRVAAPAARAVLRLAAVAVLVAAPTPSVWWPVAGRCAGGRRPRCGGGLWRRLPRLAWGGGLLCAVSFLFACRPVGGGVRLEVAAAAAFGVGGGAAVRAVVFGRLAAGERMRVSGRGGGCRVWRGGGGLLCALFF